LQIIAFEVETSALKDYPFVTIIKY